MTAAARSLNLSRPFVIGFGVTGQAVAAALLARGHRPVVLDDGPTESQRASALELGVDLRSGGGDVEDWVHRVADASVVLPSPGIPASHPVFVAADVVGVPIRSEFDLAGAWDQRPLVAITGTNGKTTVTLLVTEALERSGVHAAAVGNTEVPLVAALDDPRLEVFVVECSSFRLAHTGSFSPAIAAWLNFAPDHLDAHADLDEYEAAKASIWRSAGSDETIVVANAEDPVVMSHVPPDVDPVLFGLADAPDWTVADGWLVGPDGPLVEIGRLPRRQPHDLSNALAVAAIASLAGATSSGIIATLEAFRGFPHRLEAVGEWNGVRWFNDSKATVPHAALAAIGGFESVVLIAGGRNKGLDLTPLGDSVPPVRAVVAIGDAADEVAALFAGRVPVEIADSMTKAVDGARRLAESGDVVVLSPACTSFDWYGSYGERGEDFRKIVTERLASGAPSEEVAT